MPLSASINALFRIRAEQQFGVHMVEKKSGDETELSGAAGVYGALSAVGVDGV